MGFILYDFMKNIKIVTKIILIRSFLMFAFCEHQLE